MNKEQRELFRFYLNSKKKEREKMKLEQCVKVVMTVLLGLKNECREYEYCSVKCPFYNKDDGICYLKQNPCDYEISEIEKAVSQIIDAEMR